MAFRDPEGLGLWHPESVARVLLRAEGLLVPWAKVSRTLLKKPALLRLC